MALQPLEGGGGDGGHPEEGQVVVVLVHQGGQGSLQPAHLGDGLWEGLEDEANLHS